ncbi:lanthionine synthetase C family protein [Flavobacterium jejuense]|uniref:Lanthionine synthetase C family protein n=1 Tax=Flavobacterium jejuense TaxID=1544455 RepID=A0ABX0IXY8_9FLAO|nr:lanthionine synthetase C family protein [Flavobacterium jejuense]NHN27694.1 lanthionine synthetase C family protein [Flavobacterium jejuense]
MLDTKIDSIFKFIKENQMISKNVGILNGNSGIALFLFYYSKYKKNDEAKELGYQYLDECFKMINEEDYDFPTYCSGICGLLWCLEKLKEESLIDIDLDSMLNEMDDFFIHKMHYDFSKNNFDFLHGGLGYAFYFLKRYENTSSKELKEKYKESLISVIDKIDQNSIKKKDEIFWESTLSDDLKVYNLSLSHGISSILNFLTRFPDFQETTTKRTNLIKGSAQFLINQYIEDNNTSPCFPDYIAIDKNHPKATNYKSRLAWCYGDLGIGLSLFLAGKKLLNEEIILKAIQVLQKSTYRKSFEATKVKDSGVCHGAFGVALIYKKIYKETSNNLFKDSFDFWTNEGLKMDFHTDGFCGYKKWVGGKEIWENEISILEGITGIGLTLLSIKEFDNDWDECLLIN